MSDPGPWMAAILFIEDRWKIITGIFLVISWAAGVEIRLRIREKSSPKRTVSDCNDLMGKCNISNGIRFSEGRREFDNFTSALNRLADHVESDNKTTNEKLDRIVEHLISVNTKRQKHYTDDFEDNRP